MVDPVKRMLGKIERDNCEHKYETVKSHSQGWGSQSSFHVTKRCVKCGDTYDHVYD